MNAGQFLDHLVPRPMLRLTATSTDVYVDLLERVATMVDFRDDGSGGHARRVGDLAGDLAVQLGLSHERADLIRRAAPLHDIGKIAIPSEILHKPGPLTPRERTIMQRHAIVGSMILGDSSDPVIQLAESIARHHHEKWNGSGYPDRLVGDEIPIAARIVAVADVYDALSHKRPYRAALGRGVVEEIMRRDAGTHFDPRLLDVFFGPAMELALSA